METIGNFTKILHKIYKFQGLDEVLRGYIAWKNLEKTKNERKNRFLSFFRKFMENFGKIKKNFEKTSKSHRPATKFSMLIYWGWWGWANKCV